MIRLLLEKCTEREKIERGCNKALYVIIERREPLSP